MTSFQHGDSRISENGIRTNSALATLAVLGCRMRVMKIGAPLTGRSIGALGSDEISRYHKPVRGLKVVLYGEPVRIADPFDRGVEWGGCR